MAKQRPSVQKREREFKKRERERKKREKAALKLAKRQGLLDGDAETSVDEPTGVDGEVAPAEPDGPTAAGPS